MNAEGWVAVAAVIAVIGGVVGLWGRLWMVRRNGGEPSNREYLDALVRAAEAMERIAGRMDVFVNRLETVAERSHQEHQGMERSLNKLTDLVAPRRMVGQITLEEKKPVKAARPRSRKAGQRKGAAPA